MASLDDPTFAVAVRSLRTSLFASLGLASLALHGGCVGRAVGEDEGGETESGGSTGDTGESGGSDDSTTPSPGPTCEVDPEVWNHVRVCLPALDDGRCPTTCDEACASAILAAASEQLGCCNCDLTQIECVPDPEDEACCVVAIVDDLGCEGRPFVVEERSVHAAVEQRNDWSARVGRPAMPGSAWVRERLAQHWLRVARAEHASIASFAQFILDLVALGAPRSLVSDAQQALADEIDHAQLAFGLASAYAEQPLGPGSFPEAAAARPARDLETIVRGAIREGCYGETLSAAFVRASAMMASDPVVARTARAIASDETRHAALAWRFVRWVLRQKSDAWTWVERTFSEIDREVRSLETPEVAAADLEAHGVLSRRSRIALTRDVHREIIGPMAQALRNT